ncbi:MAG: hypothetical protein ACRDMV_09145 [Streptosporangiales bacterium]
MRRDLRHAREQLSRTVSRAIVAVGLFDRFDSVSLTGFVGVGVGVAAAFGGFGGGAAVAAKLMDQAERSEKSSEDLYMRLPRYVLVVVTCQDVRIIASDRHAAVGKQLACWNAGEFSVSVSRLPFEVELWIRPKGNCRMAALRTKRRLLAYAGPRTANAVAALAVRGP